MLKCTAFRNTRTVLANPTYSLVCPEFLIFDKSDNMTTKQLKQEVVRALDQMPDEVLTELLEYLQSLQGKDEAAIRVQGI